jgi:hypothetical protein
MSNFDGTGVPIHSVFGPPIDFGGLLSEPASPKLFAKLAQRCLDEVAKLGQEERRLRAEASLRGAPRAAVELEH